VDRKPDPEPPHDILAAEAFALGEGDRRLHREPAHDVLAAEAFAMGEADRGRRHVPPDEHSDDPVAHDVLSAEEYAMPAGDHHSVPPGSVARPSRRSSWLQVLAAGGALVLARRLRRRGRAQS
jgi:hypothetical protein